MPKAFWVWDMVKMDGSSRLVLLLCCECVGLCGSGPDFFDFEQEMLLLYDTMSGLSKVPDLCVTRLAVHVSRVSQRAAVHVSCDALCPT